MSSVPSNSNRSSSRNTVHAASKAMGHLSLVGSVVERPKTASNRPFRRSRNRNNTSNNGGANDSVPSSTVPRQSRFKSSRPQQSEGAEKGFPSLNHPIGTFVNKPKTAGGMDSMPPMHHGRGSSNNSNTNDDDDDDEMPPLDDESSKVTTTPANSNHMLSNMTPDEIQESLDEIQQALSPEMIAFLKRRGAQKHVGTPILQEHPNKVVANNKSVSFEQPAIEDKPALPPPSLSTQQQQKTDINKALSAVQNYEELDALYAQTAEFNSQHQLPPTILPENESDFESACRLLRSSAPRQTLWAAKIVASQLEIWSNQIMVDGIDPTNIRASVPTLLPVSLRCVLDQQTSKLNGFQLHALVLQSIYSLLLIYAHPDHIISVDMENEQANCADIYNLYFMDDAIPTPPLDKLYAPATIQPVSPTPDDAAKDNSAAMAYATHSSSTSAQADAKIFQTDPMWTLLSKMKLLPRLAKLLSQGTMLITKKENDVKNNDNDAKQAKNQQMQEEHQFPMEAIVAISGILGMMGQRSPGAASAILHHPTILQNLLILSLRRQSYMNEDGNDATDNQNNTNIDVTQYKADFAVLVLLRTLARQSRVAASKIDQDDILQDLLPPLLCSLANHKYEHKLQQQSILLWRTLLRYGLGLSGLSMMTALSARHLALGQNRGDDKRKAFSLAGEFFTCFSEVLHGTKVLYSKPPSDIASSNLLTPAQVEALTMATTVLSSARILALQQLSKSDDGNCLDDLERASDDEVCELLCWNTARMRLFGAFLNLPPQHDNATEENKSDKSDLEAISHDDQLSYLSILFGWLLPGGLVEYAWKQLLPSVGKLQLPSRSRIDDVATACPKVEAASSAFLNALVGTVFTMEQNSVSTTETAAPSKLKQLRLSLNSVLGQLNATFLEGLDEAIKIPSSQEVPSDSIADTQVFGLARREWINQGVSAVAKSLAHSISQDTLTSSVDVSKTRFLVFTLLGRLERGNESLAAVLFSQDALFQRTGNPILQSSDDNDAPEDEYKSTFDPDSASPISSLFLAELCGTPQARKQLDHSFKLHRGFGITPDGFGPFVLDSLLSTADQVSAGAVKEGDNADAGTANKVEAAAEFSLPIGQYWLWQTLSGSIQVKTASNIDQGSGEATKVVAATLGIILELEQQEDLCNYGEADTISAAGITSTPVGYAQRLPLGSKLYYLMNVCLHPESVLREDTVMETAEAILQRYFPSLEITPKQTTTSTLSLDFARECLEHVGPSKGSNKNKEGELDSKDKALMSFFNPSVGTDTISSDEMKALEAFLEDLTNAYKDYGAQYDTFTMIIRAFILPIFPGRIRCRAINELQSIIHLLTLPREIDDATGQEFTALLTRSMIGDLPNTDGSDRDTVEMLDAVTELLSSTRTRRSPDGYPLLFAVGLLVRSLAIVIRTRNESGELIGLGSIRMRLLKVNAAIALQILDLTKVLLKTDGSKESLVKVLVEAHLSSKLRPPQSRGMMDRKLLDSKLREYFGVGL